MKRIVLIWLALASFTIPASAAQVFSIDGIGSITQVNNKDGLFPSTLHPGGPPFAFGVSLKIVTRDVTGFTGTIGGFEGEQNLDANIACDLCSAGFSFQNGKLTSFYYFAETDGMGGQSVSFDGKKGTFGFHRYNYSPSYPFSSYSGIWYATSTGVPDIATWLGLVIGFATTGATGRAIRPIKLPVRLPTF